MPSLSFPLRLRTLTERRGHKTERRKVQDTSGGETGEVCGGRARGIDISYAPSDPEAEKLVQSWGFANAWTWRDKGPAYYSPHTHHGRTVHFILAGRFTIAFPEDSDSEIESADEEVEKGKEKHDEKKTTMKQTYGPGERVDVPAGKLHEVWIGEEGSTYVIGE